MEKKQPNLNEQKEPQKTHKKKHLTCPFQYAQLYNDHIKVTEIV